MSKQHTSGTPEASGDTPAQSSLYTEAMDASLQNRSGDAIAHWRRFLDAHPESVEGHYMLAAEHAQAGQYGEALRHFVVALDRAPGFEAVRFQLGLLWATLNVPNEAERVLQPLVEASEPGPYRSFARAIVALCRNDGERSAQELEAGLAIPDINPPLRADMQKLLLSVQAAAPPDAQAPGSLHSLALSAYAKGGR